MKEDVPACSLISHNTFLTIDTGEFLGHDLERTPGLWQWGLQPPTGYPQKVAVFLGSMPNHSALKLPLPQHHRVMALPYEQGRLGPSALSLPKETEQYSRSSRSCFTAMATPYANLCIPASIDKMRSPEAPASRWGLGLCTRPCTVEGCPRSLVHTSRQLVPGAA